MTRVQYQQLQNQLAVGLIPLQIAAERNNDGESKRLCKQALDELVQAARMLERIWTHRPEKTGRGRNKVVA